MSSKCGAKFYYTGFPNNHRLICTLAGGHQGEHKNQELTRAGWGPTGHANAALYKPGEEATALPGCPHFKDDLWVLVWWFPGKVEFYSLFCDEKEARDAFYGPAPRMLDKQA